MLLTARLLTGLYWMVTVYLSSVDAPLIAVDLLSLTDVNITVSTN